MRYQHLIGRRFEHGVTDCYSLVRDFYRDNFDLELRDYARPDNWWEHGLNLYMDHFRDEGFIPLDCHPREYLPGDAFIMAVRSNTANHAAILLPNYRILHHMPNSLSCEAPYEGRWKNSTLVVVRHPRVQYQHPVRSLDLMEALPNAVRRRISPLQSP